MVLNTRRMTHARMAALRRRSAEERDTQQILEIDRKGGVAADFTTTIIPYYLLCRHENPSIYEE